jgi:hypothetical protein
MVNPSSSTTPSVAKSNHIEQGGLSAARVANERNKFAAFDAEIDAFECNVFFATSEGKGFSSRGNSN